MRLIPILLCTLSALYTANSLTIHTDLQHSQSDKHLFPRVLGFGSSSSKKKHSSGSGGSSRSGGRGGDDRQGRGDSPGYLDRLARDPRRSTYRTDVRESSADAGRRRRARDFGGDGYSGIELDRGGRHLTMQYGDDMSGHADSARYHQRAMDRSGLDSGHTYRARSPRSHKQHRSNALKGVERYTGTVRDEKALNFLEYDSEEEPATVMRVSKTESQLESQMARKAGRIARDEGMDISYRDNRSYLPRYEDRARPAKGPYDSDYARPEYETSDYYSTDVRRPGHRRRLLRRDAIDNLSGAEANTDSDTPETKQAYYQELVNAYEDVRDNVTAIVLPIVKDIVAGSNSTRVYETALAVMVLADPTLSVVGPFWNGLHAFDDIENRMYERLVNPSGTNSNGTFKNGTEITSVAESANYNLTDLPAHIVNNTSVYNGWMQTLAAHALMIDLYTKAWESATTQLNATGLLDNLDLLDGAMITNDTSVYPAGWADSNANDNGGDGAFLMEYLSKHENSSAVAVG